MYGLVFHTSKTHTFNLLQVKVNATRYLDCYILYLSSYGHYFKIYTFWLLQFYGWICQYIFYIHNFHRRLVKRNNQLQIVFELKLY